MGRIRYLKPDFFKDEDLAMLPFEIRLLFAGLWGIADKAGRLEDRPMRIKAEVFPYDNVDVQAGIDILSKVKQSSGTPFIQKYQINGQKYIQIINWEEHQRPHHTEKESTIPSMEKGMEKGKEKQDGASRGLGNGEITVKDQILEKWNRIANKYNLQTILKISDKRMAAITARLRERDFNLDSIENEIALSDFLRGINNQNWKIDFDFVFCSANNYLKILEGNYRNKKNTKPEPMSGLSLQTGKK